MRAFHLLLLTILLGCTPQVKSPESLDHKLKDHIAYLASDELEGREVGSEGEKLAAQYIAEYFKKSGLLPLGTDGYYQAFSFTAHRELTEDNTLNINQKEVSSDDYFPLNFTGNDAFSGRLIDVGFGIEAPDLGHNDYEEISDLEGQVALISISSPDGIHPHSKYIEYHDLKSRARTAVEKGAAAVLFYNNDGTASDPEGDYFKKVSRIEIPVIFIKNGKPAAGEVSGNVSLLDIEKQGTNVVGWIDNKADYYVVMGAHFDHLGYGRSGNSLYRGTESLIHNGADDNASGTALLLELAGNINKQGLNQYNYIFIAFSGEESGLIGSKYFADNPTYPLDKTACMFNMDMVGRMDTTEFALSVMGTGTSPIWDSLLDVSVPHGVTVTKSESGVGPSDYTSFYLKDIPVLGFFTGSHQDYHKPTDDYDKINYLGMLLVYDLINNLDKNLQGQGQLAFTKTKDSNSRSAPRFTVTLGVVPDYVYSGTGLKIDGVTEEKPASQAGVQAGDILIRINDVEIDDIYAYMNALSKFKKGDSFKLKVIRDDQELELPGTF